MDLFNWRLPDVPALAANLPVVDIQGLSPRVVSRSVSLVPLTATGSASSLLSANLETPWTESLAFAFFGSFVWLSFAVACLSVLFWPLYQVWNLGDRLISVYTGVSPRDVTLSSVWTAPGQFAVLTAFVSLFSAVFSLWVGYVSNFVFLVKPTVLAFLSLLVHSAG